MSRRNEEGGKGMNRYGYNDVVDSDGALLPPSSRAPKRPYEVVECMYGMIHLLANEIAQTEPISVSDIIHAAEENYRKGLALSPTERYGGNANEVSNA